MDLKISLKIAIVAGLGWTLGVFLGSIVQFFLTQWTINPLIHLLVEKGLLNG